MVTSLLLSFASIALDTCTKTAFSFKNMLYQQKYDFSTGFSLKPVLANTVMTEFEEVIIRPLISDGTF